ncbi:sugar transferase [Streptomyces albus]|uniref:sugar transferase n=1 Tax=Streptomyces sp. PHES57 TaxID=2872626 RepID=UPI001CECA942|nr:sugar transferase [Streptomyces sp. PHES57]
MTPDSTGAVPVRPGGTGATDGLPRGTEQPTDPGHAQPPDRTSRTAPAVPHPVATGGPETGESAHHTRRLPPPLVPSARGPLPVAGPKAAARRRRATALPLAAADATAATVAVLACAGADAAPLLLPPVTAGLLATCRRAGLYRPGLDPQALDELPALTARSVAAWCMGVTVLVAYGWTGTLSLCGMLAGITGTAALACAGRALVHTLHRRRGLRRPRTALVVGRGPTARAVTAALTDRPRYGLRPVGLVEPGPGHDSVPGRTVRGDTAPLPLEAEPGIAAPAEPGAQAGPGHRAETHSVAAHTGQGAPADAPAAEHALAVQGTPAAGTSVPCEDLPCTDGPRAGRADVEARTLPVVATLEEVAQEVTRSAVQDVVFVGSPWEDPQTAALAQLLGERGVTGWLVRPGCALGAHGGHAGPDGRPDDAHLWGFSCRRLVLDCPRPRTGLRKRLLDLALVTPALVLAAPLLGACALAVRLLDGPGVLFRQERIGQGGRPFTLLKFRTVRPTDDHEAATRWTVAGDARTSRIGRLLRRTSLDELPQLWNVLRGDMSLVGPRPERPYFVRQFSERHPGYAQRHRTPVGITGLAQVYGLRGDTSIEDRARFDNHYIETWSLWQDIRIMCRTATSLFRMEGR